MYFIYNLILILLGIILSPLIILFFILKPKLRAGFWQKIDFYSDIFKNKPVIWFHAVSVGEVNAIEALVKRVKSEFSEYDLVLTTVTKTGQQVAQNKLGKIVDNIVYFPYDFSFSVKSAIKFINPKIVIIAETEIWPNFSHELNKKKIPLILVNGRISPGSYKQYKKFRFFFKNILENYSLILMQTEEDQKRIIDIGANSDKVEVMGNLKFDFANILDENEVNKLKNSLKLDDKRLLIAGSTHKNEDEIILSVFKRLKQEFSDLKLIIAPRHPERNSQVLKLISMTGFKFGLKSKNSNFEENDIILLDTMGELGKLYSIAYLAFIGGSFSNTGGHNPLEAAIYGVPVLSGPTVFNFKDIYYYMTNDNAANIVNNEQELYFILHDLLTDQDKYELMNLACKNIFKTNKGALDFAINKLSKFILSSREL
ncbi:MAG: 3-deoxy-D-manno-octulosonic acid transferase [bacterium]